MNACKLAKARALIIERNSMIFHHISGENNNKKGMRESSIVIVLSPFAFVWFGIFWLMCLLALYIHSNTSCCV